jgi:hypothetical protein
MRRFLAGLLLGLTPAARGQAPTRAEDLADPAAYISAKARYDAQAKPFSFGDEQRKIVEPALKELEARIRAIVGLDSIRSQRLTYTLTWLPCCDAGGFVLDGLQAGDSRNTVLVSTAALIANWVRMLGGKSQNPLDDLNDDSRLSWVFAEANAHVYPYAEIVSRATLPPEVFLAKLVARSNGDVRSPPDELIVGIRKGRRVFLMIAPAKAILRGPKECGSRVTDTPEYRKCFDEHVTAQRDFAKIVTQVRELAAEFSRIP